MTTTGGQEGGKALDLDAQLVDAFMDSVESFVKAEYTESEAARFKERVMLSLRSTLIARVRELEAAPLSLEGAREALRQIEAHLTNLQPHIPQACYPGHAGFIDNYVNPCLEIARRALQSGHKEGEAG
jgi:hypothetical protein